MAGATLRALPTGVHFLGGRFEGLQSNWRSQRRIESQRLGVAVMSVYQAIHRVSAAMSVRGISKDARNQQQGYNFRGIDSVLNALSTALVEAGLVILPRCVERNTVERVTAKGGALFYVTCKVEFDLVSTEDGSKHTVCTYGEAMDSADKATNKAMSAAYKYLAFLVFCIPTEATPESDADFITHDSLVPALKASIAQAKTRTGVVADVLDTMPLSQEDSLYFRELAENVEDLFASKGAAVAFDRIKAVELDSDQTIHLWSRLGSKVRTALKIEGGLRNGSA
jgi:ERF superfamily